MEFNLADLWEKVADTIPEKQALADGSRRFTYAALDARANALAHVLERRGVKAGDHIGVYLYNCSEYIETMLAAFKLRAVPINVNYRYVEDELRYLFTDADAVALVADVAFAPKISAIRYELPLLHTVITVGADGDYESLIASESSSRDFGPRSADDHYMLYTGGTTGMPKGVIWRHQDVFFGAMGGAGGGSTPIATPEEISQRCVEGRTRVVPACPFMHGTAHWMALSTLFVGGAVIIDQNRNFNPAALWRLIADEAATFLVIVGDAFARPLVEAIDADVDLSSLQVLLSGGAILSPAIKEALVDVLPGVIIVDGYGASETGGQGQSVTVGGSAVPASTRFTVNGQTMVLDDDLNPAKVGVVGRLARRGHIPLGYYKDPEKTAATFPTDANGDRWSVPGDHARLEEDGNITLLGRGSMSINTGGEKVYPEEIESALKSHPTVFDAVVVGVPDERFGERVVAVVQARESLDLEPSALMNHVRLNAAAYKAPRSIIPVENIQRLPSGKPDYRWARTTAMNALGLA